MFFRYNYPGIIWALIILILLGLPPSDFPSDSFLNIPYKDKIVHVILFLILALLLARGFALQNKFIFPAKYSFILALVISTGYGGLTEMLQGSVFTQRTCDVFDFIFDFAGSLSGAFLFIIMKGKIMQKRRNKFE